MELWEKIECYTERDVDFTNEVRIEFDGVNTSIIWNIQEKTPPTQEQLDNITSSHPYILNKIKDVKIKELDIVCEQVIESTFISSALGEPHIYKYNKDTQASLDKILMGFVLGELALDDIMPFLLVDLDTAVNHTISQMLQVYKDGALHKQYQVDRFWGIKDQVKACTSKEEVEAVTW